MVVCQPVALDFRKTLRQALVLLFKLINTRRRAHQRPAESPIPWESHLGQVVKVDTSVNTPVAT